MSMLSNKSDNTLQQLENIFEKFNIERPEDFKGHSLSVSDVVVLKNEAFYVDSIGFVKMSDFMPAEMKKEMFVSELPTKMSNLGKDEGDPQGFAEDISKDKSKTPKNRNYK